MKVTSRRFGRVCAALVLSATASVVRADVVDLEDFAFGDAAYALDFIGFELIGRENPLTNGIDFAAVANFPGSTVNFGVAQLALSGPVSFDVSYGRRLLHTVDIGFTTALSSNSTATPLTYNWTQRLANQTTTVSGSMLVDGDLRIDQLGFYDLNLRYSSRGDYTSDGPFGPQSDTFDADLGPINVSGNVFVDLAAVVFGPVFERAGRENFFEPFSGIKQIESQLAAIEFPQASALSGSAADGAPSGRTALTPSPSTLVLLAAAIPIALLRRRRR